MATRAVWVILLLVVGTACDGDARVAAYSGAGRASRAVERGAEGGGGAGGADRPLHDEEEAPDARSHDVAEGPCPLGARRRCKAITDVGCLEGAQYCVDGAWSPCLRDVGGGGDGPVERP